MLGAPPYRTFVLDELREATNNFDISNLIGASSSGQVLISLLNTVRLFENVSPHGLFCSSFFNSLASMVNADCAFLYAEQ